ncbi:DUF5958 family protein [Kutzneria buriramensis]|uniref:Uncharacterized protein n=1 Tax=Kutzneria buriramensis TaxID=1045776 RepID=A0A3E0HZ17_9PSEU|nr:DUF5958 family protein [Kutzneria buriramensis]REH51717.1 hypothetical protein BCF44_103166 [Kutzneria buriramensis]
MREQDVLLNELAQGIRPLDEGVTWFHRLTADEQAETLRLLTDFCVQARATADDAPESARRAGIKPTHTPAVLLAKGKMSKITGLPVDEWPKAFRLLVALLGVADERRRARFCTDGCSHAWHHLTAS